MAIHPSAIIDSHAEIHSRAEIGPMVVIAGRVKIGAGTVVDPFVHILGFTEIGTQCHIHSGAIIGDLPQDKWYEGGESYCRVGDHTVVREGATIHRGTAPGSATLVGNGCLIMANAHVGHNCTVGDDVTLVNGALLGGYVSVAAKAIVSGNAAVHQYVRIGELAMIGGLVMVTQDVPPFMIVDRSGECVGPNVIGLRRAGFTPANRDAVKAAFRILYRSGLPRSVAIASIAADHPCELVRHLLSFFEEATVRGIKGPRNAVPVRRAA